MTPLIWAVAKPLLIMLVIVGGGAILLTIISVYLKKKGWLPAIGESRENPYVSKKPLTETEQKFYFLLKEALPECIILAQVQLSSIIGINKLVAKDNYYKWLNPIRMQSVDYLVCLKDFTIVAAIELDDKYHWGKESAERDLKKEKNLEAAGIALLRWRAEAMPKPSEIRRAFQNE
jgi:hypothetical protein